MKSEIAKQIKNALIEVLNLDEGTEILGTTKLKDNLGLDSMSSLTFLVTLEENIEEFVVDADTLQMSDLETVNSISQYVIQEITKTSFTNTHLDNNLAHVAYA